MRTLRRVLPALILALLLMQVSIASAATTMTVTTTTDKASYAPGEVVKVSATGNYSTGSSVTSISSAKVTIKNPSGTTIVNAATMTVASGVCSYNYTLPSTAPSGTWTVTVTIKDRNRISGTGTKTYTVATAPVGAPTVSITAPAANAQVSGQAVAINANVAAGATGATVTNVTYQVDAGAQVPMSGPVGTASGSWTTNWNTTSVIDGTHTIKVTATNSNGLTTTSQVSVSVRNNTATVLTIQTVQNRYKYTPGTAVIVRATAQRGSTRLTSSRISSAKVTIKNPSGTTLVNAVSMSKDTYTGFMYYSYSLATSAPKGVYTVTVTVTDSYGYTGTGTNTFKVQTPVYNHSTAFTSYAGTKTCITSACHASQANAMFSSAHYQWRGDNSKAIELAGSNPTVSKMGGINNYCIQAENNWLTIWNNLDGSKRPVGGCAWCHAGLGLKPTTTSSTAQLENIDCLICHSPTYKRVVVQNVDGTFSMVPDPTIDIQAAAKNIIRPGRAECMRCHQNAGGGNNYKRGDIESTNIACDKTYDVHMGSTASGGKNFLCQDCHRTDNHKMAGRGVDMRALDTAFELSCESCHTQLPHRSTNVGYTDLNRHSDRVNCTVCHIKAFAKTIPTDMHRNWAVMEIDTAKQLYDPEMIKQTNVKPEYAWYNTFSHFYKFRDPAVPDANGVVKLAWPDGTWADNTARPVAKLYPFKLHLGDQPMETTTKQLLPLRNKVAFETGDVNAAISAGAAAYGMQYSAHTFQRTQQYNAIHHTVGPKTTALASCSSTNPDLGCHGNQTRIPFTQLGYERRGTNSQLCDVCHGLKSFPGFTSLHSKHREVRNCTTCHGTGAPLKEPRTTLCDNCHSMKSLSTIEAIHNEHVQEDGKDCGNCHVWVGATSTSGQTSGGHYEEHSD